MATNFPGSQDSFTNPTSSDTLDSPDHAAQHANVNDAVEAIELALLDGAPLHIDDANQRVGIGTTSPDSVLHIEGGTDASGASGSGYLQIGPTASTNIVMDDNEIMARNNGSPANLFVNPDGGYTTVS